MGCTNDRFNYMNFRYGLEKNWNWNISQTKRFAQGNVELKTDQPFENNEFTHKRFRILQKNPWLQKNAKTKLNLKVINHNIELIEKCADYLHIYLNKYLEGFQLQMYRR